MATPTREALDTYMTVTGASESQALLKLQEHGNDLAMAVNAHFAPSPSANPPHPVSPHNNSTAMNSQARAGHRGILPILSAARSFKPSSLLDPNYRRDLFNQIGVTRNSSQPGSTGDYGNHLQMRPPLYSNYGAEAYNPSLYENYHEEQMIHAAIEASKQETSSSAGLGQVVRMEDEELNRAIALSIETAEKEQAILVGKDKGQNSSPRDMNENEPRSSSHPDEAGHAEGSANQKFNLDIQISQQAVLSDEQSCIKKANSLPQEPPSDDENSINIVVRMPDGSRHGRRFLKSDKLQSLFAFIDLNRLAEPHSYRLVAPYPRRAWAASDSSTFSELGLTGKQEALFLELI